MDRKAKLEDIILFAPRITFETGFKGCAQAFASEKIFIEPDAQLYYPSVLLTSGNNSSEIVIGSNSKIEGTVFNYCTAPNNASIKLQPGSVVEGQVISKGSIQHFGTVNGQVICNSLFFADNSGQYLNLLKDGIIDRFSLRPGYLFPGIFEFDVKSPGILINLN